MTFREPFFRISIYIIVCAFILIPSTQAMSAPSLAGEYYVKGWDPGAMESRLPDYKGWVKLDVDGECWKYHGFMDGQEYSGVGIYDRTTKTLCLCFSNTAHTENGVTVLKVKGNELIGKWTYLSKQHGLTGHEIWTLKK